MATEYSGEQKTTIGGLGIASFQGNNAGDEITSHRYTPGLEYILPNDKLHYVFEDEDA